MELAGNENLKSITAKTTRVPSKHILLSALLLLLIATVFGYLLAISSSHSKLIKSEERRLEVIADQINQLFDLEYLGHARRLAVMPEIKAFVTAGRLAPKTPKADDTVFTIIQSLTRLTSRSIPPSSMARE